ncbi:hypothetical protein OESDEN_08387, partial [Oesophagostomum dentatum]
FLFSFAAACVGCDCVLFTVSDGRRIDVLEHGDELISAFFVEKDKIVTVTANGEMVEWALLDGNSVQLSSHKITAFSVRNSIAILICSKAVYLRDIRRFVIVVDRGNHLTVENVLHEKSLVTVARLPADLHPQQIAITSRFIAYCIGKEVFIVPSEEDSDVAPSSYVCKTYIEGLGDRNAENVFVRITALDDTIAAVLAIGRVYIWSHVSQKGLQDSSFTVHWHKVAPSIALTQFGGLLSAGAEAVLCKFSISGAGRPSMLPRLPAAVRDLAVSADASHVAVILEDNSVHVVVTSSMNILSTDPCSPGMLVTNGKPGSLQWISCLGCKTINQTSFSLENVADGDMSFTGIIQTFPDVEQVFFSNSTIVTLEVVINFDEEHKRLRFWERIKGNDMAVRIVDSFIVPKDTVAVTGCKCPTSDSEKLFLSVAKSGKSNIWIPSEEGTRFKLDPTRQIDREYEFHAGSLIHRGMWASAYPEDADEADVIVVWDMNNMSEIDILRADGKVSSVDFDGNNHLISATDKGVKCWRHVAMQFEFLWVVEQPLGVHVSPLGGFAWNGNSVLEFDVQTAALKGKFQLAAPVISLLAVADEDSHVVVVAKTEKGLLSARPKTYEMKKELPSSAAKTPFASLAPVDTSSKSSGAAVVRPAAKAAAIRLFDGPCHALPPVSHLAPLFIAQCLAPPLPENS